MSFYWPHAFWFLLVPLSLAALEISRRRRAQANGAHPKILRAEAGPQQLSLATTRSAGSAATRFRWRLWLGFALAVIALARPQWGRLEEPVFDQSREIVIALDLSRSMLAEDVRPSRLARARLLVTSLLERLAGERVGLIVFSGTAFLQSPLSADYEILREFLPDLQPSFLPEGGTNYEALLNTALTAFGAAGGADRYLIVLSDGEATDDAWKKLVDELKTKGVKVIGLGIGTPAGAIIPDGNGGFVKDERGAVVLSKLENSTLQQLAAETGGIYTDASSWVDLPALLERTVEAGQKGEFREQNRVRLAERFQWALAPALLFLLWAFWREFPVHPRQRDVRLAGKPPSTPPPLPGKIARAGAVAALLLFFSFPAPAQDTAAEPLSKLIGQFSSRDTLAARDYAELARATLTYGERLQSAQKPVPEGPIRDAVAAVDAGEGLDKNAADWPKLRNELNAFLQKPPAPQPPPPSEQPEKKPEQNQQQEKKQQQQDKQQNQQNPSQQNQPEKNEPSGGENAPGEKKPESADQKPAFGDMNKDQGKEDSPQKPPDAPPPEPGEVQKVGGAPEKKDGAEPKDPALAIPLQKLEQLRNQDSPARLHQLMRGEPESKPGSKGKNW